MNSLKNKGDKVLNRRYMKMTNLIQRNPVRDPSNNINLQENGQQMKTDQSLFSNEILNFSEKIENFSRELQAMRGQVLNSKASSTRPTANLTLRSPIQTSKNERFISERITF